jgi:TonB family protein
VRAGGRIFVSHSMASECGHINRLEVGASAIWLVSITSMELICRILLLVMLTWTLSLPNAAQTKGAVSELSSADLKGSCVSEEPLLADKDGKPIWLSTDALLKSTTHCTAPRMPAFARQARIEGDVLLDILVSTKGEVVCVRLISGHPMLASSAINAAKDWTFQPMKQDAKAVSFYGHLSLHFSTGGTAKNENPCTVAHW